VTAPAPGAALLPPARNDARIPARLLVGLPARLPLVLFWCALVVSVAVLGAAFTPWLVLPVLTAVLLLTWRLAPDPVPVTRATVQGAGAALTLVLLWLLANVWFAAEVLLVQRDPGFLTLEGLWLAEHADPDIPLRSAAAVADAVPGASAVSDAFWRSGGQMYAQGAKTFPGLLAIPGWLAGQSGVLAANLLIGAVALLAVYDLGRRLIDPRWALLPTAALALSTPFLHFTRAPFTEPTNVALTCGGLAVLWGAFGRPRLWPFALGGAMVGANALSRIDGAAVAAGLVLGVGAVAAGTVDPARRRHLLRGFLAATGAACAMVLLGYLDVQVHSAGYLADHAWLYVPLVGLLVAAVLGALVAIGLGRWTRLPAWLAARGALLGQVAAWTTVLGFLVLASRPLWMARRGIEPGSNQAWFIAAAQEVAGLPVDGTRSYDEMTLVWLAWYLGPLAVVLGAVGAAMLARRAVAQRRPELVVLLVTLGVPSLLYLLRPSITPDVVWAMRRFLPAVIPAVLLGAGWFLHWAAGAVRTRAGSGTGWLRAAVWLGVAGVLLAPLATWGPITTTAEYGGRAGEVAALCREVRGGRVVVVRSAEPPLLPTVRIVCDADVIELPGPADAATLAEARAAWGGGEVFVLTSSVRSVAWPAGRLPTLVTPMARWPHAIRPSNDPIRFTSSLYLGRIGEDGTVEPVGGATGPDRRAARP
jgi:hypothetical protein